MKKQNNQSIKAHLIRSALYVLLLVAVCVIPFALAQRTATNRSVAPATSRNFNPATAPPSTEAAQTQLATVGSPDSASAEEIHAFPVVSSGPAGVRRLAIPPYPKAPQVILYDQYDNAGADSTSSQNFEPAFDIYDDFAADDFIVPGGQTWNISEVDVLGAFNGAGPVNSFNVFIYQDSGGLPGALVYSATDQLFTSADNLNFVINLTTTAVLTQGTYWVSVQANMDFAVGGQWYWTDRTVQSNQGAAWQNPGGGFGVGCMTWGQRGATCGIDPTAPDQVFRLVGELGGGSPTPTPTATGSPSATATPTATPTATGSPTVSPTITPTATASPTVSPTVTPTATASPTVSPTVTPTATVSPTATATATPSGTPTVTPTPTATPGGCVRTQGFWKNHPEQWPVTELQLGNVTYNQQQLLDILHEPVRGNGLLILAHQLIAAKLNIAAGADPSCIEGTIAEADALIGDLVIPPIGDGHLLPRDAAHLAGILGDFNEGDMCAPTCDANPSPTTTPIARRGRPNPAPRPR
jgi:hypothetical protein